jgi:hypothetical protein
VAARRVLEISVFHRLQIKSTTGWRRAEQTSAPRNNDVLDFKRLQRNAETVTAYCKKHKADALPKAINKTAI